MEVRQSLTPLSGSTSMDELRSFIRIEKCPLCERTAKNFYCRLCVRTGDFGHSRDQFPTRFADRKLQLFRLKHEIINYAIAVEDATAAERRQVERREREAAARHRVQLLQAALAERRARIVQLQAQLAASRRASRQMRDRQPRMRVRLNDLRDRQQSSHVGTERLGQRLEIVRHALKGNVRGNVRQLVSVVFPVSEVQPRPGLGRPPAALTETESALAEAQSLAYVRGRWVQLEPVGELQYRVVEPTLPGSGDYSAYHVWAAAGQEPVPTPAPTSGSVSPVHNLSAALTYTAQLLNVIAFYMDVRPRNRLCYSEFCRYEMSEREFNHRVAKLNANLVCLCLHAGVDAALLEPRRTAYNLTLLLGGDLGRRGAVSPPDALVASMEESMRADLDFSDPLEAAEAAARPSPVDDSDADWEQVPHEVVSGGEPGGPGSASVAAGLVSTAAASVASFLRGFNR
ncbi:beclin 1-associated autophagy-related key regulator-like [Amphibalanus amphitrite]|uniref:beclin 1-associated autophagy-related key regulator-like n=1 Tax=Amphibalanus amphitrite TaxID=1232801 RepID=UPI001C9159B8|nr:beclin 1-associated autophagy-related key regulator-like [Amphibalanus amphitrite]XP_043201982.1 beclin 1-associated autophagy-related key regulator-like [Amphibalanus amphitrite]XP_043201983.1 beclin 1-associated autophagy-related key regulator-like [Amphibalanus amphitrite]